MASDDIATRSQVDFYMARLREPKAFVDRCEELEKRAVLRSEIDRLQDEQRDHLGSTACVSKGRAWIGWRMALLELWAIQAYHCGAKSSVVEGVPRSS
jgi:hypothetical protein